MGRHGRPPLLRGELGVVQPRQGQDRQQMIGGFGDPSGNALQRGGNLPAMIPGPPVVSVKQRRQLSHQVEIGEAGAELGCGQGGLGLCAVLQESGEVGFSAQAGHEELLGAQGVQ